MAATKEDQRQPGAEFLPGRQWVNPGFGVPLDFEVIDPAERRAQLVLDPALDTENVDFEPMCCVGDVAGRALFTAQGCQSAQQCHCHRRRRTGTATSRDGGTNTHFHRETRWGWERVDGGLQERVAGDSVRRRDDGVPVARRPPRRAPRGPDLPSCGSKPLLPATLRYSVSVPARQTMCRSIRRCHRSAREPTPQSPLSIPHRVRSYHRTLRLKSVTVRVTSAW